MDVSDNNEKTLSLGSFLDSLDDGHQVFGESSFSVAADKALHKLQNYSLADPGLYVVELLAFAVAQGSKRFFITSDGKSCRAEFDGQPLATEVLTNPLSGLFSADAKGNTHFALAITGAKQLCSEDGGVTYDDGKGAYLTLRDGKWVRGSTDCRREFSTFVVHRPFRFMSEKLRKKPSLRDVLKTCKLAPLTLRVDDKYSSGYPSSGIFQDDLVGRLALRGRYDFHLSETETGFEYERAIEKEYSAVLYFGDVKKATELGLVFVRNGVSYRTSAESLGPGVCGYVYGSVVKRDLGGKGIVLDSRYRDIVDLLLQHRDAYVNELVQSANRFRKANVHLRPLLERMDKSEAISNWLTQQDSGDSSLPRTERWERIELAAKVEQWDKVEELSLLELAIFLSDANNLTYQSERFFELASKQLWVRLPKSDEKRLIKTTELVAFCRSLTDKNYDFLLPPGSPLIPFLSRVRGQEAKAESEASDSSWGFQSELERHFLHQEYETICQKCQTWLKASSPEEVKDPFIYDDIFPIEYWAQALELLDQKEKSAAVYKNLLSYSYNELTNHLRKEQWFHLVRAKMSFFESVKTRVQISGQNPLIHFTNWREHPPRIIQTAISGRPVCQEELLRAFREYFDKTGLIYKHLFSYCWFTVSHKLRLLEEHKKADQVTALGRALLEAFRLRDEIQKG